MATEGEALTSAIDYLIGRDALTRALLFLNRTFIGFLLALPPFESDEVDFGSGMKVRWDNPGGIKVKQMAQFETLEAVARTNPELFPDIEAVLPALLTELKDEIDALLAVLP